MSIIAMEILGKIWPYIVAFLGFVGVYFAGKNKQKNETAEQVKRVETKAAEQVQTAQSNQIVAEKTVQIVETKNEIGKTVAAKPDGDALSQLRNDWQRDK